jgi:type IV pilus assembly protein PilA
MRKAIHTARGFTLIELMIVVTILAVLAAVAIVSYTRYTQRAKNSEATSILADIRLKQEAYRATFHQFADVSGGDWIPDGNPGIEARNWPTTGDLLKRWNQLGVRPDHGVYFSYYCEAGAPGSDPVEFQDLDIENQNDFWFGARAVQDLDGNGKCGGFEIYTGKAKIVDLNEEAGFCP